MCIKLAVSGRPPVEIDEEIITLGSDPSCTVVLPEAEDAEPKHAVIRTIRGRWMIEVHDAESILVGVDGAESKRSHWLTSGDVIRLTKNGPHIIFHASSNNHAKSVSNGDTLGDSDPLIPIMSPETVKKPSTITIPTENSNGKPPSSSQMKATKPQSSAMIPSRKSPSSATMKTTKASPSGVISTGKSNSSITKLQHSMSGSGRARNSGKSPNDDSEIIVAEVDDADERVLERMSSWDELPDRKKRTAEQEEIQWIISLVTKAVGAGVAIVVVWIIISALMKSLGPQPLNSTPSTTEISTKSIVQIV